ncbi:MAG: nuclear transport factor 2 family protein [Pseudomonadota bacterium]
MFNPKLIELAQGMIAANAAGAEATQTFVTEHYADDVVSVEALDMAPDAEAGGGREAHGKDAIFAKHAWWDSAFETHDTSTEGPFLHGDDQFTLVFSLDATNKATGERNKMREVGLYTVRDGKIAREEFFYALD